jgi:hypothetical protein
VAAVTRLVTPTSSNVDLRDIRVVKKIGGTIEDTELVDGVVLNQNVIVSAGGPTRMEKAKIAIVQFQLSAPKPDVWVALDIPTQSHCAFLDGQHSRDKRLSPNGQSHQGGTAVSPQHLQKNQKSKLQRASDPKIHPA